MWKLWAVSDITVLPWAPPAFLQWDRDQVGGHGEKWIITGERMNTSLFFFFPPLNLGLFTLHWGSNMDDIPLIKQ